MDEIVTPFPNFFIIGVHKAGTTSLYNYLRQHPKIFMSREKEPNTLFYEFVDGDFSGPPDVIQTQPRRKMQDYVDLFKDAGEATAVGEASFYLYSDNARNTLQKLAPNARFIVILRNPVDRAYSNYLHLRRVGEERNKDFRVALAQEEMRIRQGYRIFWQYKSLGLYAKPLKEYFSTFGRQRFYIQLYENWQANNRGILEEIFTFLKVDSDAVINTGTKFQVGYNTRFTSFAYFLYNKTPMKTALEKTFNPWLPKSLRYPVWSFLAEANRKLADELEPNIRQELLGFYRQDILELQDMIEMDLSHWLEYPL